MNCPNCGREVSTDFAVCPYCATPLAAPEPRREERKVVTVLFCDIVGSTGRAERMDPEDVRALLSRYHERVRRELERFGGTVEKFIGDAVMALFGAPVAHEDDPERAVRAALAIRDWAGQEPELQVRIGVTTGEALVSLGARPEQGEGMASGDVVNTAARLQTSAPPNGIVVDETTYRATERAIELRARDPVEAKGKAQPVKAFEALEARARVHVEREAQAPLLGRQTELELLLNTLARVRAERSPQLVTLVGVPGIGKSRLVYELFKSIERGPDLVFWRRGRSLPYGEGVTFWALAEMVKAQAGILEDDRAEEVDAKVRRAVLDLVPEEEGQWVERHLRPLVGLEPDTELGAGRREEAFAAWRRFLEALAERRPLVLVFEDLHWADEALLDFVDELVDWASGVPMLVICTARPELLAHRPGWGGGKPNAVTISLQPLSEQDTAQLVHALLDRAVLPAELQTRLLEHAGGNPLYAEEFARLAQEQDLGRDGDARLPESVQGIIAARLDALSPEVKALLHDAAVVGRVFWAGALTHIARRERRDVERTLHGLERREFIRRERRSSVTGEAEHVFRHLLVRDVAYGQIPRAQRAEKHTAAAQWIESLGRREDHAETLANHYLAALAYARSAALATGEIAERARFALREAGDRSFALNAFEASIRFYSAALELWPEDADDGSRLLFRLGAALHYARDEGAEGALVDARQALLRSGEPALAAEADALLAELWWHRGRRDPSFEHLERARELARELPSSGSKARVLSQVSRYLMIADESEEAIEVGREALAMATDLGLDEVRTETLINIGTAKFQRGDVSGIADLERSIEVAESLGFLAAASRAYNNLAFVSAVAGDERRSLALRKRALETAERLGSDLMVRFARGGLISHNHARGRWDEYLGASAEFLAESERLGRSYQDIYLFLFRAHIRLARGDEREALQDARHGLELAREAKDPQAVLVALAQVALVETEAGLAADALAHADELLAGAAGSIMALPEVAQLALFGDVLGRTEEFRAVAEAAPGETAWLSVLRSFLRGDYAEAADLVFEIGYLPLEARARLRAGEQLVADGRRAEADVQLQKALAFYRSVGATRYIREGEALLEKTA